MILCAIPEFRRYVSLHPDFRRVADFLEHADLDALPEGRTDIQGEDLFVIAAPEARTRPEALLEAHRKYIDVQVILDGVDTMGWASLEAGLNMQTPYDAEKDILFFRDAPTSFVTVGAGQLVIFFPEDAHAPLLGQGEAVRKLVLKVKVA